MHENHPTQSGSQQFLFTVVLYIPFLVVCAIIFWLSSMPHPPIPAFMKFHNGDKVLHMVAFFLVGFTAVLPVALSTRFFGLSLAFRALCLAALYAAVDEFHQAFVPLRQSSYLDFIADIVGACLGILTFWAIASYLRRNQKTKSTLRRES